MRTAALLLTLLAPASLQAQNPRAGGAVTGTVLAAATGQPLVGAAVVLEASSDAAVVSSSGSFLGRSMTAVTDEGGSYRFVGLQPGSYRLLVRHLGFHPQSIQVDLAQAASFRVSVGLVINPIRLEPMDARATTTEPYGRMASIEDEARYGKLDAEQYRDQRFLEGDATVLTHQDVTEAVTLGETDLFRALQRLPGVSTRDDFNASLWTRGAPWSQTRVYFDGLPLFNPVHAIGVLSGLNPDAIGGASFHPGVRPSSIGEGAAGVLNVTSRPASRPGVRGLGELSVSSARTALDWGSPSGRGGLTIAARRSYIDLITRLAEGLGADSGTYFPYDFFDITARADLRLADDVALEASGLWEQDGVRGDVPDLLRGTHGHWGNRLARVSVIAPLGSLRARHTIGISDFSGVARTTATAADSSVSGRPTHGPMNNSLSVLSLTQEIGPATNDASWSAGLQFTFQRQHYDGQYPRPYPVRVLPLSLTLNERLGVVAAWAERRVALGRHVAFESGLRVEAHERLRNAGAVGVAPKLTVRATPPGSRITFTAAAARSYQYSQALAPAGPSVGPDLYVTDVWLLAGDTIPAVRADIATVGAEAWLGQGWVASLNLFGRRATGVAVPEPDSGRATSFRPIFAEAENRADGIEFSARRIVGRWTASASYSLSRSAIYVTSAATQNPNPPGKYFEYWSSSDRRHTLDLSTMVRLGTSWRVGAAFTAASGAPFTRFLLGCDSGGTCQTGDSTAQRVELPNAERAPGYAALDLLLDWSRDVGRVRIGAYLQIRNALNRVNQITYTGTLTCPANARLPQYDPLPGLDQSGRQLCDRFDRGLPILPLGGIRIAF